MGATVPAMFGPYELRGELGRGAMARVWRAWDPRLRREVAIKEPLFDPRLPPEVLEEMGRRFVAEAVTAARLNHPNIVTIYEADVFDGKPAIVMELIDGATLSQLLERGSLDMTAASEVLEQLLSAAGYAHARGIVHRDIKPDNIFVNGEGLVKLADFGIAHTDELDATRMTVAGSVLGTPGYMAPEQITGAEVDARSDLFSIGVVGYEMISGHNPFGVEEGIGPTTLAWRVVNEPTPKLVAPFGGEVPVALASAIMAALSKDPIDRPQSAEQFLALLHGEGRTANVSQLRDVVEPNRQKRSSSWLPYAVVAIIGIMVLMFSLIRATSSGVNSVGTNVDTVTEQVSSDETTTGESEEQTNATSMGEKADATNPKDASSTETDESDRETAMEEILNEQPTPKAESSISAAESFPRIWHGSYEGHSSRATNYYVARNIDITFDTVSNDGTLEARCLISSYDEGEGSLQGSYGLTGSIDWETGSIHLYGSYWIDSGDLVWMRQFHGTYDAATRTITGESSDLKDGSNESGWTMSAT